MTTTTQTTRYGTAVAQAWDRLHPRLTHRSAWLDHDGPLPVIEGTLIRLQVDHLPGDRDPKPVWLWCSGHRRRARLRWTGCGRRSCADSIWSTPSGCSSRSWAGPPRIRDPAAADRWTWIVIACHAQLRLARPLAADLRLPWERPAPPGRLTPARVRRGFRTSTRPCPADRCTETRQARPRPPARIEEPPPSTPPRRGEEDEEGCLAQSTARTRRLNDKLRACLRTRATVGGRARRRVMTMIMAQ